MPAFPTVLAAVPLVEFERRPKGQRRPGRVQRVFSYITSAWVKANSVPKPDAISHCSFLKKTSKFAPLLAEDCGHLCAMRTTD